MIDVETYAAAKAYTDTHGGGGSGDGDMKKSVYDSDLAVANAGGIGAFVDDAISGKVDKVEGKGLSTNDYDNTEKGKVADNTGAIEAIVNVNGACNLCPVSATTKNHHGITFTVNSDGSITASGTADSGHVATIDIMPKTDLAYGTYKGSGGVNEHCRIIYGRSNSSGTLIDTVDDSGEGIELTVNASTPKVSMALIIDAGTDLTTPVTFYPMLYDARLNPTGYVPYAMTNRELTDAVNRGSVSVTTDGVKTYKDIMQALYALVDYSKLNVNTKLDFFTGSSHAIYGLTEYSNTYICFQRCGSSNTYGEEVGSLQLGVQNRAYAGKAYSGAEHDISSTVLSSGLSFTVRY